MRLIVTGVLFLIGGLSGTVALRGTGSPGLLAVVGIILIIFGAVSLGKENGGGDYSAEPSEADRERDSEQWAEYQRVRAEQAREQQAEARAEAAEEAEEEAARPVELDPNDPRTQRLEAIFMIAPEARPQVDEVLARTRSHLNADEQLNLALETARRVRDSRSARA